MRPVADIFRSNAQLDAHGRHVNGTDKQSNHNYGDVYDLLFMKLVWKEMQITSSRVEEMPERRSTREDVKLVMEVGVADGSCLIAWREVFPNADIVGMDIHLPARLTEPCYAPQRPIEFCFGDQRSMVDCERAAAGRQFDMIVEDATHELANTLLTLLYLWPAVRPGGIYVIEEFSNVGALRTNIAALWPCAEVIDTQGPFGGIEPLVVLRKPDNGARRSGGVPER